VVRKRLKLQRQGGKMGGRSKKYKRVLTLLVFAYFSNVHCGQKRSDEEMTLSVAGMRVR
jgi:hypothetical protein